jgi:DNA-binding transcriptional ArsR family regulator
MSKQRIQQLQTKFKKNTIRCENTLSLLSLLANKTRFHILCTLLEGEFCVNDIKEAVGANKVSNISIQLKSLTLAKVITRKKKERKVLYSLTNTKIIQLVKYLQTINI